MTAFCTKKLPITTGYPDKGVRQVQVSYRSLGPAVSRGGLFPAAITDRMEPFVGFCMDVSFVDIGKNSLFYNFDSTKGKVWCYSGYGHRRPPVYKVFLGR